MSKFKSKDLRISTPFTAICFVADPESGSIVERFNHDVVVFIDKDQQTITYKIPSGGESTMLYDEILIIPLEDSVIWKFHEKAMDSLPSTGGDGDSKPELDPTYVHELIGRFSNDWKDACEDGEEAQSEILRLWEKFHPHPEMQRAIADYIFQWEIGNPKPEPKPEPYILHIAHDLQEGLSLFQRAYLYQLVDDDNDKWVWTDKIKHEEVIALKRILKEALIYTIKYDDLEDKVMEILNEEEDCKPL